jgi:hypothetical protein
MREPARMEVLAASRGRFLKTPKVSAEAQEQYLQILAKPSKAPFNRGLARGWLPPGVFSGLTITVRFRVERLELLANLPRLLPGHLQALTANGLVTITGPVLSLMAAWGDIRYLAFSPEWEELGAYLHGFNKTIAEEFPEDSLLALQALIDRKDAINERVPECAPSRSAEPSELPV